MPSQHRYPAAVYRTDPRLRKRAQIAVHEVDSDLNSHIVAFLRWLVHDTDALPPRPSEPIPQPEPDINSRAKTP
ncbi:MAG: hypothetical protein U5O16_39005 [Rhodococcus sp. (in: high G+C Gram-positive bacteria)]|uniref:hypothetical protein n=1 Tax=Rhodococcus sp. TaxID=1831 RepID=UPI002AD7BB3D|nr:hypothetical protein [Rhodococcus sp. (in: high G+C Gram-positive bacteria)]